MKNIINYFLTRSTKQVFQLYLLTIFIFGYIYWVFSIPFSKGGIDVVLSLPHSTYFSVVTITTLGYGDISPLNLWGMLLTGTEAILGIITLGLLLNSISIEISNKNYNEMRLQQTSIAISLLYLPNYSTISSYMHTISDLAKYYSDLKHPILDGTELKEEDIDIFKSSLNDHLGIIPIELTKLVFEEKMKATDILDKIYAVSDPTINTRLQLSINKLSNNVPHIMIKNAMLRLKEDKEHIITKGNELSIKTFSGFLQSIEKWLKDELALMISIKDDLDDFTNTKKQT